ncbi:MAG: ATP-binding protein [Chloroflexi bacterium]|nr:ATP-binding protein [Chloroflexota bacterium]
MTVQAATHIAKSPAPEPSFVPSEPKTLEETGLSLGFLAELALKIMYSVGFTSGAEVANALGLPFSNVTAPILEYLRREHLCEVTGTGGIGESNYRYILTDKGRHRGLESMDRNQYVGQAPVPLTAYVHAIRQQSVQGNIISDSTLRKGLSDLVLNEETLSQLGPAINSGRSMFLFGPPGNGKTAIGEAIGRLLPGDVYIPYTVHVEGHIIKVFDLHNHRPVDSGDALPPADPPKNGTTQRQRVDKRWIKIRRPAIIVGGELNMENLDLVYDGVSKTHEAPFQMKANNGMLLIDDFGRQQARPRELLNRWIMPLERRVDYLTLQTGKKLEVPFDLLIVFSTNLEPRDLVDEAFLRRIRYKIPIVDPSFEEYREIFRRVCQVKGIPYEDRALAYLLQEHYIKLERPLRAVHPRDVLEELVDIARFRRVRPCLTKELLDQACRAYFVKL